MISKTERITILMHYYKFKLSTICSVQCCGITSESLPNTATWFQSFPLHLHQWHAKCAKKLKHTPSSRSGLENEGREKELGRECQGEDKQLLLLLNTCWCDHHSNYKPAPPLIRQACVSNCTTFHLAMMYQAENEGGSKKETMSGESQSFPILPNPLLSS